MYCKYSQHILRRLVYMVKCLVLLVCMWEKKIIVISINKFISPPKTKFTWNVFTCFGWQMPIYSEVILVLLLLREIRRQKVKRHTFWLCSCAVQRFEMQFWKYFQINWQLPFKNTFRNIGKYFLVKSSCIRKK